MLLAIAWLLESSAAAALSRAGVGAGVKGVAARAARHGVRVAHGEAAAHQAVDEVDLRAAQVHGRELVDQQAHALGVDDRVTVFDLLFDRHAVLEARATTGSDEDAQGVVRRTLLLEEDLEL